MKVDVESIDELEAIEGCDSVLLGCAIHEMVVRHPGLETEGAAERARTVCARCDVWRQCLAFALRTDDLRGIWGGLTDTERARCTNADFGSLMRRR
jgi:predicted RecB family nuclease